MSEVLSLQLRPNSFREMIGQQKITRAIQAHYKSGREPRAWMFIGGTGAGKTTIARILALSLNCTHQEEFGNPCDDCQKNKSDFDTVEVNASEVSKVEEIAAIASESTYTPLPPSRRRIYILDEAHRLSDASQNLLLKYAEDSPKTTVWIFCTTEPGKLLRTLRGRCVSYPLEPLTPKGISVLMGMAVKAAKIKLDSDAEEDLLNQLVAQKVNSPRLILMALEKLAAGMSAEQAVMGGEAAVDTLRICQAVVKGDWETVKDSMKNADLNDARSVRLALGGYLKTVMLTSEGAQGPKASDGITLLAEASRTEEGIQLAYTVAILHKIVQRFKK